MHFALAVKCSLPLFLHDRNTDGAFFQIMKEQMKIYPSLTGVVHSFTGNADLAKDLLSLGLYIGINGCSLKTGKRVIFLFE
jgi:TatD DNase family protein